MLSVASLTIAARIRVALLVLLAAIHVAVAAVMTYVIVAMIALLPLLGTASMSAVAWGKLVAGVLAPFVFLGFFVWQKRWQGYVYLLVLAAVLWCICKTFIVNF